MRVKLEANRDLIPLETLAEVRSKLPHLWQQAARAVALGQDHLARLALRRRLVVIQELESLAELLASHASPAQLAQRIQAANRLVDASLIEVAQTSIPPPRDALAFDPAIEADLAEVRSRRATRHRPPTHASEDS